MSEFGGASNHYNILDIINNNSSRNHLENCIKYIVNDNKDIIFLLVDNGQQA
jgi:hypothetical protein